MKFCPMYDLILGEMLEQNLLVASVHAWEQIRWVFGDNIGIKHNFLCINICWAMKEVLKPEPERRGFQHFPRGPTDVNVSEKHA